MDIPPRLELTVGEHYAVELPGLGTSGYVWDAEIGGEPGVVQVQWSRGFPADEPSPPVGASAPETATIRAERPGTAEILLYQHRRWEPPERIRVQYQLSVLVRST